jgi:hypothetical protein
MKYPRTGLPFRAGLSMMHRRNNYVRHAGEADARAGNLTTIAALSTVWMIL